MVRVSSLGSLCERAVILSRETKCDFSKSIDAELMWTFGIGTAYHRQMQQEWLLPLKRTDGKTVLQGWWNCTRCGTLHVGSMNDSEGSFIPPEFASRRGIYMDVNAPKPKTDALYWSWIPRPSTCLSCSGVQKDKSIGDDALFEYVEIALYSKEHRLTGHVDGVLAWSDDDVELLELKTIGETGFASVQPLEGGGPKPEHVVQLTAYQMLTGVHRGRFVYILKSDKKMKECMIEHSIGFDANLAQSILESVKRYVSFLDADEGVALPAKKSACVSKTRAPASYCSCNAACFKK